MEQPPEPADIFSGDSGAVFGVRATTRALASDAVAGSLALARGWPWRLPRAARAWPERRILALAVERPDEPNLLESARRELVRSRHDVRFVSARAGDRGKFENLNALLSANPLAGEDWLVIVDDDVALPPNFLDVFLFLSERFGLQIAQPAHRARSHAAWKVTRRRAASAVRQTAFVEIGPVVAFHRDTFALLLPFPELRIGWGLDLHWSAVAREQGWRLGVVDATPIRHGIRRIASAYDRADAVAEARRFLSARPYTRASEAQRTLVRHRSWS
jgi:hypothetical protein